MERTSLDFIGKDREQVLLVWMDRENMFGIYLVTKDWENKFGITLVRIDRENKFEFDW